MKNLTKYLAKYAESEIKLVQYFPQQFSYQHVVVIPAYKESSQFVDSFINSSLIDQQVLMIVVINQPDYDNDIAPQALLYKNILEKGTILWQEKANSLVRCKTSDSAILLIDRFNHPVSSEQGVGLARKIGVDIACELIRNKVISTNWIHSTDADAQLPQNYFNEIYHTDNKEDVAACYNFTHKSGDVVVESANQIYEKALRYYVAGLTYAGSQYNFFTIGSVMTFKADAYANVRGFPKKSAGEDFYLLNKLAKQGRVAWFEKSTLILEARTSDRVPFGTGPAVQKIIELTHQNKEFYYYHPEVFEHLKELLIYFNSVYERRHNLQDWFKLLPKPISEALIDIGFEGFLLKQVNAKEKQFYKQLHVWFDAFKTLKFIHHLRENILPDIPLSRCLTSATFEVED